MQKRHLDRKQYFIELATTSKEFFIPYILRHYRLKGDKTTRILEIGCGDGGNLLPFSLMGCHTIGIDISVKRIADAGNFFTQHGAHGKFIVSDILSPECLPSAKYDIILCHDVIEHIGQKKLLLRHMHSLLKPSGIIFMSFPAWQMPFGGHQQICHNCIASRLPYFHLLPTLLYRKILAAFGESNDCISELINIKSSRMSIEMFEKLVRCCGLNIIDRQLWFINPHYKVKFGLRPTKLPRLLSSIPYLRNYLSTSCFYILQHVEDNPIYPIGTCNRQDGR